MLSCEAALLYNVLAALGRYGEGRFGNGVLYDGSDPPVLQYNAAALIALGGAGVASADGHSWAGC